MLEWTTISKSNHGQVVEEEVAVQVKFNVKSATSLIKNCDVKMAGISSGSIHDEGEPTGLSILIHQYNRKPATNCQEV